MSHFPVRTLASDKIVAFAAEYKTLFAIAGDDVEGFHLEPSEDKLTRLQMQDALQKALNFLKLRGE